MMFDIKGENQDGNLAVAGERMYVIISEKIKPFYIEILDNELTCSDSEDDIYLCFGAEVLFQAEQ